VASAVYCVRHDQRVPASTTTCTLYAGAPFICLASGSLVTNCVVQGLQSLSPCAACACCCCSTSSAARTARHRSRVTFAGVGRIELLEVLGHPPLEHSLFPQQPLPLSTACGSPPLRIRAVDRQPSPRISPWPRQKRTNAAATARSATPRARTPRSSVIRRQPLSSTSTRRCVGTRAPNAARTAPGEGSHTGTASTDRLGRRPTARGGRFGPAEIPAAEVERPTNASMTRQTWSRHQFIERHRNSDLGPDSHAHEAIMKMPALPWRAFLHQALRLQVFTQSAGPGSSLEFQQTTLRPPITSEREPGSAGVLSQVRGLLNYPLRPYT